MTKNRRAQNDPNSGQQIIAHFDDHLIRRWRGDK